jgi:putative ABC transport system permease protein
MRAVILRARAELRSRVRSWLGLALLVGLVAGLVIAATAGARRTDSAYERFLVHQRAADVLLDNYPDPGVATVDPETVERLPQVASAARAAFLFVGETGALAPVDARLGRDINRPKVLEGRLPAPGRVEEIAVGFERARQLHWRVGTRIPLIEPQFAAEAARYGVRNIRLRVVGIVATPGDFPPLDTGNPSILLTPAFHRAYADTALLQEGEGAGQAVIARLEHGSADLPAFRAAVERLARGKPVSTVAQAEQKTNVQRTLDLQASALWVFAAILALTGIVVLSQTLARQAFLDADEHTTLHAIGMTRRQLWAVGVLRAVVIGAIGAAIALALAVALSPLAPLGPLAGNAEPDPGISIDAAAFAVGAAATVLITVLLASPAAWVAARGAPSPRTAPGAGSAMAGALARLGASSSILTGVRMALEPGRGRNAIPVRTAIVGVTVGVMGFAAALTFNASTTHLLDTPRLYGWNWDLVVTNYGEGPDLAGGTMRAIARDPAIEGISVVDQGSLEVEGRHVSAFSIDPVRGSVLPPVIEGRAPAAGEILLGAKTMRALDLQIGDTATIRVGARTTRMRVVGQGVFAAFFSNTARLGQGVGLLFSDLRRLNPEERAGGALLRLAPGTDRPALLRRLRRQLDTELFVVPIQKPLDIVDFGRVSGLPLVLTGLLGALAAATLAHVLMSAVRRRRRDLAVLKALGFVRAQVRTVVFAQSLTYAAFALLVGLPLGVAAGRFGWNMFATEQGIVAEVAVPLPALLLAIPSTAVLAGVLALFPARRAAATPSAAVLRAE